MAVVEKNNENNENSAVEFKIYIYCNLTRLSSSHLCYVYTDNLGLDSSCLKFVILQGTRNNRVTLSRKYINAKLKCGRKVGRIPMTSKQVNGRSTW